MIKIFNIRKIISLLIVLTFIQVSFGYTVDVINTNPSPIVAGDYADITVRFTSEYNDQTFNNFNMAIKKTKYIRPLDDINTDITKVFAGETISRTYRVFFSDEIEQGTIRLPVEIAYNGFISEYLVDLYIEDTESSAEIYIGEIRTTPNELLADTENNEIQITLQNLGDKDAEVVYVELKLPSSEISGSYSYSLIDSLSSIKSGEEEAVTFTIDVEDGVIEPVEAELFLRYRVESSTKTDYKTHEKILPIRIEINEAPLLKVINVEQLSEFKIGTSENKIKVTLRNDGNRDADEVRVRVVPDVSYPFSYGLTTQYVSSKIKPGEEASVEFEVEVFNNAQIRDYSTTVLLESLIGESRYSKEDSITVSTSAAKNYSSKQIGLMLLLFIFIVSGFLGYKKLKNKK